MVEQTNRDTLIAVRGARDSVDPNYACIAHDGTKHRYDLLGMREGRVVSRDVFSADRRHDVEKVLKGEAYRGITIRVDERRDRGLLPLTAPSSAIGADLSVFRRSKSDGEIAALTDLFLFLRMQNEASLKMSSQIFFLN